MSKEHSEMTPEELEKARAYNREYKRKHYKKRGEMTPEELEAVRAYYREYTRKRRKKRSEMSPEELEKERARVRESKLRMKNRDPEAWRKKVAECNLKYWASGKAKALWARRKPRLHQIKSLATAEALSKIEEFMISIQN